MFVFTDKIEFAKRYIDVETWQPSSFCVMNDGFRCFADELFNKQKFFYANLPNYKNWEYLFLVEYAESSQYDSLLDAVEKQITLPNKMLCIAGDGKNFHGFHNRNWQSQQGNIHLSVYFKPNRAIDNFGTGFMVMSAVSVVQALDLIKGNEGKAAIKWVNDIFVGDAKIAGVLAQAKTKGEIVSDVVLGIGLNVESTPNFVPDEYVPNAACINDFLPIYQPCTEKQAFSVLTNTLLHNYNLLLKGKYRQLLDYYASKSVVIGKNVIVTTDSIDGDIEVIAKGAVKNIGENLELFIDGIPEPITSGRLILK